MDEYPYNEAWKATVDHSGEAWRSYCEAVALLKQYFKTRALRGRRAAKSEFEAAIRLRRDKCKFHEAGHVDRLQKDFYLIGSQEGERIEAEVLAGLEMPDAA